MAYCSKCGKEVHDEAEICVHCGCRIKDPPPQQTQISISDKNLIRFCLTFFLGWIGSIIINSTEFKPKGWRCRTLAYFILGIITCGIYPLVASLCNFSFNENGESNVGYYREENSNVNK